MRTYAVIALAISSSMVYHMLLKMTPEGVHPTLSLTVTYATAALVFKEKTSLVNVAGVLVAAIGLAMMVVKG